MCAILAERTNVEVGGVARAGRELDGLQRRHDQRDRRLDRLLVRQRFPGVVELIG